MLTVHSFFPWLIETENTKVKITSDIFTSLNVFFLLLELDYRLNGHRENKITSFLVYNPTSYTA